MRKERVNCKVLPTTSSPHLIVSSPRRRGSRRQWKQSNSSRIFQGFVLVTFLFFTNIVQLNASLDPRLRGDDSSGDLVNLSEEPQGFIIPLEVREENSSVLDRHLRGEWGFSNDSRGSDTMGGCSSCGS